tara:strand:+ start:5085 stop:5753 length:669 start_codon:yes stop_codon:yes gene_type:complete
MAYGMSSAELARVGQNVNRQSGGVSDQSIAEAMDKELSEERKESVGRFKARKRSAVKDDAKQKAALKSNLVKAVVKSGISVAGAAADAKGDTTKSERISARADKAGARGNVVRQAKLQDKAAAVKGKEEIRVARQATQKNQQLANQQSKATKRAGSKRQQERLAEYDFEKRFGANRGLRSPRPLKVKSTGVKAGSIFDQQGGAGRPKTGFDELLEMTRKQGQ